MSSDLTPLAPRMQAGEFLSMSSLEVWAEQAKAAAYIAKALASTPFVPASLRVAGDTERTTANVAAALLTGQELGLEPMAALRSIDVINGTPALRAVALRALVQRAGHQIWLVESSKTQAIVKGKRRGDTETQESKWTIERARDLGLTGRDQWKKQPAAMLVARATAELCRLIASDVILGLAYAAEELDDPEPDDRSLNVAAPRRRTAQRRPVGVAGELGADEPPAPAAVEPTPPDDPFNDAHAAPYAPRGIEASDVPLPGDEPPTAATAPPLVQSPPPKDDPKPLMINAAQRRAIFAAMRDLGIADDDDRHAVMSRVVGHQVESTNHLMRAEAIQVLAELDELRAARDQAEDPYDGLFGDEA